MSEILEKRVPSQPLTQVARGENALPRNTPEETSTYAIEVVDMVKHYPHAPSPAVSGISFQIRPGEFFGLLGPNGAGKSTTIGILTTRIRPTSGQAFVVGYDVNRQPAAVKKNIAIVPQRPNLDNDLNARENLLFHAAYFGVPRAIREKRASQLLESLGLKEYERNKPYTFSGGMVQRVMIARALMTEPAVLFLDEPTTGLDPQSRLFLWEQIQSINQQGTTVVLTTHNIEEADRLCHRVGIMDHGQLLALDTPQALKMQVPDSTHIEVCIKPCQKRDLEEFLLQLMRIPTIEHVECAALQDDHPDVSGDSTVTCSLPFPDDVCYDVVRCAHSTHITVREIRTMNSTLEDIFIALTGKDLRA